MAVFYCKSGYEPRSRLYHKRFVRTAVQCASSSRQFECIRLISPEQIIATIKKIPTFRPADPPKKEKK